MKRILFIIFKILIALNTLIFFIWILIDLFSNLWRLGIFGVNVLILILIIIYENKKAIRDVENMVYDFKKK